MFLMYYRLSIEVILDTEETKNQDCLEINVSKMMQLNREAMESL